jgi:S-adenosylmethionine:tRNA ribosyltransferase-isomerase
MSKVLNQYLYEIPEENIRKQPLAKRDDARLFIYDTKANTITYDTFSNIAKYLPEHSLMVLNNTGVIPARVSMSKDTGGKFEALFLMNERHDTNAIPVIVDRKLEVGRSVSLETFEFIIVDQQEERFFLKPCFDQVSIEELLMKYGTTPTPNYLGEQELKEDALRKRYQTIFAKDRRSVAAPTASLHFTEEVFASCEEKGIVKSEVTLNVGLGTFAEVREEQVKEKRLHHEELFIPHESYKKIQEAKQTGKQVIAVGTTAVRTLESQAEFLLKEVPHDIQTSTNLFIMPPYHFRIVDVLITNFHVSGSSLMALVDAYLTHKGASKNILELYEQAIRDGFSFYSFGDSMLIL